MGGGADAVTIDGLSLPGGVFVDAETVRMQSVRADGLAKVTSRKSAARVTIDDSTFRDAVSLQTGKAADLIQIETHGDPLGEPKAGRSEELDALAAFVKGFPVPRSPWRSGWGRKP